MATTMENKMQLIDGLIVSISDRIPRGPTQQPSNEIIQAVMKRSEADGTDVVDCSEWSTLQQYLRKELKLPNKLLFKFTGTITVGEKEMPQNIWNATGLASLRRTLLREPLEALEDRAVVELDLVLMGAMPKPQAPTPRTDKQKGHEQKRFNLQELVYGDTKRQKNVSGEWTEMASLFMMSDTDLMRQELTRARSTWRRLDGGAARRRSGGGAGRTGRAGCLAAMRWQWGGAGAQQGAAVMPGSPCRPRVRGPCLAQSTYCFRPVVWTHLSV